jgi:hypothetical protein
VEPLIKLKPGDEVASGTVRVHKSVPLVKVGQVVEEDRAGEHLEVVPPVPRKQVHPEQSLNALNDEERPILRLSDLVSANGCQHWMRFI